MRPEIKELKEIIATLEEEKKREVNKKKELIKAYDTIIEMYEERKNKKVYPYKN